MPKLIPRASTLSTAPAVGWFLVFMIAPLTVLFVVSLGVRGPDGGYDGGFTLDNYTELGNRLAPITNTLKYSVLGTAITLLVAYPLAYYLAIKAGRRKVILLALIIVPFWTSMLIRTYAWTFLLGSNGLPRVLADLGLVDDLRLLNTPYAILLGIVYNYLPLMLLPIYVALERLDPSLRAASKDLGAGRLATFRQITLPLSAPGVVAGCLLVLIPVMGEYLIPVLLGGGRSYFLGNALADLFLQSRDWPLGAAMAGAFILLMTAILLVGAVVTRRVSGAPTSGTPG
jgi:spermidine/putrescine transport system permease protein